MPHVTDERLSFAWDRSETASSLRDKLRRAEPSEWLRLASWILREAKTEEVWHFLTLQEISQKFPLLEPRLGRQREFWAYVMRTAHELGRV